MGTPPNINKRRASQNGAENGTVVVTEQWLLDSVTRAAKQPVEQYMLQV